jgi:hypothetical protein
MKNLSIIVVLMITLSANAQARFGSKSQDICEEFDLSEDSYINDPEVGLFLLFNPDPDVIVSYYLDKDSICTSVLIQTLTKEMTDFMVNNYTKKEYLKIEDGWLMRDNGFIFKIIQKKYDDGGSLFYWY